MCVNQIVDVLFCTVSSQLNKTDFRPPYEDWENCKKIRIYSTIFGQNLRFDICYFRNLSFTKICSLQSTFSRNVSPFSSVDEYQDAKQPAAFTFRVVHQTRERKVSAIKMILSVLFNTALLTPSPTPWCNSPHYARASSLSRLHNHMQFDTPHSVGFLSKRDQPDAWTAT